MDHKEQHHQHHQKEREEKKKEQHKHELQQEKKPGSIHPLWFAVVGLVLVVAAVLVWTFVISPPWITPLPTNP